MSEITWHELDAFSGVDLEDSWVLSWSLEANGLVFELEASLWPGHPAYEKPAPDEHTCYRRARLVFPGARNVVGLRDPSEVTPTRDPDGSLDYGSVDALVRENAQSYRVSGEFGAVRLESGPPRLELGEGAA